MKHFCFLVFTIVFVVFSYPNAFAVNHNVITEHKSVTGVCDQCKNRIENASYIKGVKFAEWDSKSQDLTIKYDTTKTSSDAILKSIAIAGHDNEKYKATDEDYNKLPKCCRYKTVKKH